MNKFKGFLYGMTASATFGLLPLFTLPTMAEGMTTDSILCYRMLFASLLVAVLMMVREEGQQPEGRRCSHPIEEALEPIHIYNVLGDVL